MKKQFFYYAVTILIVLVFDIFIYQSCIINYLEISSKDGLSVLIAIITTTTILPVYLFTRLKEFDDKKLEIDKSKAIKNYELKYELFKSLVPFLFIKNNPANLLSYEHLLLEIKSFSSITFGDEVFTASDVLDYGKKYVKISNNPRFRIYTYAQTSISRLIWTGHLILSENIIIALTKYNSIPFNEDSTDLAHNHMNALKEIINSFRIELINENLNSIVGIINK